MRGRTVCRAPTAKHQETFIERHRKALGKAHAELLAKMQRIAAEQDVGVYGGDFCDAVATYADSMWYCVDDDGEVDEDAIFTWNHAYQEAWQKEVCEKGDRLVLGDALDRAIKPRSR
jgi:hypothetical protein